MDNSLQYKYQNDKDIIQDCLKSFDDYFDVVFKSFKIDKKTFILQVINLVLVFIFLNFFITPLASILLGGVKGSGILGLKILLLLVILILTSLLSKNLILKWQTLFEMNYEMAKKYFLRFIFLNLAFYGGKKLYKIYETRN